MARDQIAYMENPTPLFRRVRDAKGRLQLSNAAQIFYGKTGSPSQGVYRSPYKNFMRITRTTINDAYRQADMIRYQTIPFIISYNVNLSNNHPKFDICDSLAGIYPKTFVWTSWHLQCLCNCTSNLASPEEFERYRQALHDVTADKFKFSGVVENVPDQLTNTLRKIPAKWITGKENLTG